MNLYDYLLLENAKILKRIFEDKLKEKQENINELLAQLNDNNNFLKNNVSRETFEI